MAFFFLGMLPPIVLADRDFHFGLESELKPENLYAPFLFILQELLTYQMNLCFIPEKTGLAVGGFLRIAQIPRIGIFGESEDFLAKCQALQHNSIINDAEPHFFITQCDSAAIRRYTKRLNILASMCFQSVRNREIELQIVI
jgi:hypothetical protein